jgi:hypothetical protein
LSLGFTEYLSIPVFAATFGVWAFAQALLRFGVHVALCEVMEYPFLPIPPCGSVDDVQPMRAEISRTVPPGST